MPNEPILASAVNLDLSSRVIASTTVVASPAGASETIVASVTLPKGIAIVAGVLVLGQIGITIGTGGNLATVRIRQTNVSGTQVATGPGVTEAAANADGLSLFGFDTSPADGQVYKLTITIGSASGASSVTEVALFALAI